MRNGPYQAWLRFCEDALAGKLDDEQRSNFLWTLGNVARRGGVPDQAFAAAQDKQALDRSRGADREAALASGLAADILQARGQLDDALAMHTGRLAVAEAMGDIDSVSHVKFSCASIRIPCGGWEKGEAQTIVTELAESFSIAKRMQRADFVAGIGAQFGQVLVMAGMRDDGLAVLETAVGAFETLKQTESAQRLRNLVDEIRAVPAQNDDATRGEADD